MLGVGHQPHMCQIIRGSKGLCSSAVKHEVGHKHIACSQPKGIAQQRQCTRNTASGFQCVTKIVLLVRVLQLHAVLRPCGVQVRRYLRAQPGGVDHHMAHTITLQSGHVPVQQGTALHGQQGFRGGIRQRAHAFAAACGQQHGGERKKAYHVSVPNACLHALQPTL